MSGGLLGRRVPSAGRLAQPLPELPAPPLQRVSTCLLCRLAYVIAVSRQRIASAIHSQALDTDLRSFDTSKETQCCTSPFQLTRNAQFRLQPPLQQPSFGFVPQSGGPSQPPSFSYVPVRFP